MTSLDRAHKLLLKALDQHARAQSEAEIERSVLALHTGLEQALRTYLSDRGYGEVSHRDVNFPALLELIENNTDLFADDPGVAQLLNSLNTTRNAIAHPMEDKPAAKEIARDAGHLARLSRRFWPALFGEVAPPVEPSKSSRQTSTQRPPEKPPSSPRRTPSPPPPRPGPLHRSTPRQIAIPTYQPAPTRAQRTVSSGKVSAFFKSLWYDKSQPRLEKWRLFKRIVGIAIYFTLAKWCKDTAIFTARWPEPVKYGSVALILVAAALFCWLAVIIWRVLKQLRLKRLLIGAGIIYGVWLGITLLTSASHLPLHQQAWEATKRLVMRGVRDARDVGRTFLAAPGEFRFAYTGYRAPILPPGIAANDTTYLTPIPASGSVPSKAVPAVSGTPTLSATTAAPLSPTPSPIPTPSRVSLYPPDCPYPLAHLRTPLVNQVISAPFPVEGTANIETFDYYKFEIRRDDDVDDWHWLASYENPVENGVLGELNILGLPDGVYIFRLIVVNQVGNYPFPPCEVRIRIQR